MFKDVEKFLLHLYGLLYCEEIDWRTKYKSIFNEYFREAAIEVLGQEYPWKGYDPDSSYEEDVKAYVTNLIEACRKKMENA
jgi:hypothetical protein